MIVFIKVSYISNQKATYVVGVRWHNGSLLKVKARVGYVRVITITRVLKGGGGCINISI